MCAYVHVRVGDEEELVTDERKRKKKDATHDVVEEYACVPGKRVCVRR